MLSEFKKAWKESGEQARASRERDRQERKEKRRREAFPGKYSKMLYQIFWKNFLYNWKDYVLLLVCGIIMSAITFALLGSYQAMSELHSNEGTFYLFGNVGEGIQRIVVNAMFPLGSCAIFLLVYVLLFYLKKRMLSYSIFVTYLDVCLEMY